MHGRFSKQLKSGRQTENPDWKEAESSWQCKNIAKELNPGLDRGNPVGGQRYCRHDLRNSGCQFQCPVIQSVLQVVSHCFQQKNLKLIILIITWFTKVCAASVYGISFILFSSPLPVLQKQVISH